MESLNKKAALLIFLIGAGSVVSPIRVNAQNALDWNRASISTTMVTGSAVVISSSGARYLLDGVAFSSTIANNSGSVEFRDTNVANTTLFVGGGTGANLVVFSTAGSASIPSASRVVSFNPPVRFYYGISVNATGCGTLNTPCYTVLYRRIADD